LWNGEVPAFATENQTENQTENLGRHRLARRVAPEVPPRRDLPLDAPVEKNLRRRMMRFATLFATATVVAGQATPEVRVELVCGGRGGGGVSRGRKYVSSSPEHDGFLEGSQPAQT